MGGRMQGITDGLASYYQTRDYHISTAQVKKNYSVDEEKRDRDEGMEKWKRRTGIRKKGKAGAVARIESAGKGGWQKAAHRQGRSAREAVPPFQQEPQSVRANRETATSPPLCPIPH